MNTRPIAILSALLVAISGVAHAAEPTIEEVFNSVQSSVVTLWVQEETAVRDAQGRAQMMSGNGSGVLLEGGRILTAAHVVHTSDKVTVEYVDGTRAPARVIGSVVQGDVALIQVDDAPPAGVRPAVLGDSDQVSIGSRCFVVGAPLGLTHTLTVGYISARRIQDHPTLDLLDIEYFQTDASMNPGNSGGPMFDMKGQVIGIVSFGKSSTGQGESVGLGFAVTSNATRRHLLERNSIWSGMTEFYLTGKVAEAFQLPPGQSGFLLQRVTKGSPADRLGLVGGSIPATIGEASLLIGGDILISAMGVRLDSPQAGLSLLNALPDIGPDTRVTAVVLRAGKVIELEAKASNLAPWLKRR